MKRLLATFSWILSNTRSQEVIELWIDSRNYLIVFYTRNTFQRTERSNVTPEMLEMYERLNKKVNESRSTTTTKNKVTKPKKVSTTEIVKTQNSSFVYSSYQTAVSSKKLTTKEERENEILETYVRLSRAIRQTPNKSKRRTRVDNKIVRHESERMRTIRSQTDNDMKAIYTPDRVKTPILKEGTFTTLEVGPGDEFNRTSDYRAGFRTR